MIFRLAARWSKQSDIVKIHHINHIFSWGDTESALKKLSHAQDMIEKQFGKGGGFGGEGLQTILFFRLLCFAVLGHKKRAEKCLKMIQKKLRPDERKNLDWINGLIQKIKHKTTKKLNRSASTVKCSNPTCEKVEAKVREFMICSRCSGPSYCCRECQ